MSSIDELKFYFILYYSSYLFEKKLKSKIQEEKIELIKNPKREESEEEGGVQYEEKEIFEAILKYIRQGENKFVLIQKIENLKIPDDIESRFTIFKLTIEPYFKPKEGDKLEIGKFKKSQLKQVIIDDDGYFDLYILNKGESYIIPSIGNDINKFIDEQKKIKQMKKDKKLTEIGLSDAPYKYMYFREGFLDMLKDTIIFPLLKFDLTKIIVELTNKKKIIKKNKEYPYKEDEGEYTGNIYFPFYVLSKKEESKILTKEEEKELKIQTPNQDKLDYILWLLEKYKSKTYFIKNLDNLNIKEDDLQYIDKQLIFIRFKVFITEEEEGELEEVVEKDKRKLSEYFSKLKLKKFDVEEYDIFESSKPISENYFKAPRLVKREIDKLIYENNKIRELFENKKEIIKIDLDFSKDDFLTGKHFPSWTFDFKNFFILMAEKGYFKRNKGKDQDTTYDQEFFLAFYKLTKKPGIKRKIEY